MVSSSSTAVVSSSSSSSLSARHVDAIIIKVMIAGRASGLVLSASLFCAPRTCPPRCAGDAPWPCFCKFNVGAWRGYAVSIDPKTFVPNLPGVEYDHFVAVDDPDKMALRTTTTTRGGDGEKSVESIVVAGDTLDIDLDGSYSVDHPDGLSLANLLAGRETAAACTVIEHSLAVSDDERRRAVLTYDSDSGELETLLLLSERRGEMPDAAAHSNLISLVGSWTGDACVRSASAASQAFSRTAGVGFGSGAPAKAPTKRAKKSGASPAILATRRTNVFKAALTYAWDGATTVMRQLQVTSFSNEALDAIRTTGRLTTSEGAYGEYESVAFFGDELEPSLILLPAGCHLIAPRRLPTADAKAAFSTEFGALLDAGESFGWRGFTGGEEGAPAQEGDAESARLVRIQRLYAGRSFVSGTTSLLTAE